MDQLAAGVEKRHVIQLGSKKLTIVVGSTPTFNAYSDGKPMRIGESEKQAFTPALSRRFANRPSHTLFDSLFASHSVLLVASSSVFLSHQISTSYRPVVLFSHRKSAPTTNHNCRTEWRSQRCLINNHTRWKRGEVGPTTQIRNSSPIPRTAVLSSSLSQQGRITVLF